VFEDEESALMNMKRIEKFLKLRCPEPQFKLLFLGL
jgi:hypothetical protein